MYPLIISGQITEHELGTALLFCAALIIYLVILMFIAIKLEDYFVLVIAGGLVLPLLIFGLIFI